VPVGDTTDVYVAQLNRTEPIIGQQLRCPSPPY
jgi:hypothetical protein